MSKLSLIKRFICIGCIGLIGAGCGTTDPSPVGIDLVDLAGGEVVEVAEIRPIEARSRFREIFPSVLGRAEEMLVGRMNGVNYVSLFEMTIDLADLPGGTAESLVVDSVFVELNVLGNLNRGNLGKMLVFAPDEAWTETRAFVDTTDFLASAFARTQLGDTFPTEVDSTIRVQLPVEVISNAFLDNPTHPVVEFGLSGDGTSAADDDFLLVAAARDTVGSINAADLVVYLSSPSGQLVLRKKPTKDTYFAERVADPAPGEILLQTGVFSAGVIRFDLPTIPESATVNLVELTLDYDFDQSFLTSLRLRIEQIAVDAGDTTAAVVSGNLLNEQIVSPVASPFVMNLDQLLFHGWMSGARENHGLIINPIFDIVPDLRYEWALFSNPRVRVVYSFPPAMESL